MVENSLRAVAVEVEVRVVGEVKHSLLVGGGSVVEVQSILIVESVHNLGINVARESGITVRSAQSEFNSVVTGLVGFPYSIVEALGSAMQAVAIVVLRQHIFYAIEREFAVFNTVSVSANEGTEVTVDVQIVGN